MPAEAEQSTVYRVDFDDRYAGLVLADEADMDALGEFRGSPRAEDWKPVRMRWEHDGASYPQPDFAYVLGAIAISARAREAIGELLDGRVECLSVDVEDGEPVWLANVLHLSDALDEADSEFAYFRSGRIMHIERHAFHPERLQDETVFRVRQVPRCTSTPPNASSGRSRRRGCRGCGS